MGLCTEIIEYTSADEVAVCNLASVALPSFVQEGGKDYDFEGLYKVTKVMTKNLNLPSDLKSLYKTVWEIKQRTILDMAAARGTYIDQSQSLNIHMVDATTAKLSSMHFHGWQLGLKTGMYYLRTKAAVDAIKFTVD